MSKIKKQNINLSIIQSSLISVRLSVRPSVHLKLKILVNTELIGFFSLEYILFSPVVVLSYFLGVGTPQTPPKKIKILPEKKCFLGKLLYIKSWQHQKLKKKKFKLTLGAKPLEAMGEAASKYKINCL